MNQLFAESDERRRKRARLMITIGIIAVVIVAVPIAWVGTLTTSYLIRIKSGERIDVNSVRTRATLLKNATPRDASSEQLDTLVPSGLIPEFGNRDARLTIVAFLDYECPYSADFAQIIRRVMESEKSGVRLVIRDFPVIDAVASRISANAARCALDQGQEKYWRFFDELFADQSKRTHGDLLAFAKIAGADVSKFEACLAARSHDLEIDADFAYGQSIGTEGTPTIFMNRAKIQGAMSEDVLREIIVRAKDALPK